MLRMSAEGPPAWAASAARPSRSAVVVRRKEGRRRMLSGTSISASCEHSRERRTAESELKVELQVELGQGCEAG